MDGKTFVFLKLAIRKSSLSTNHGSNAQVSEDLCCRRYVQKSKQRSKDKSTVLSVGFMKLIFYPFHAIFCVVSLCRGSHLSRGMALLVHVRYAPLIAGDMMTGGIIFM